MALAALRRGESAPSALAGMAEDVSRTLALLLGCSFPAGFYSRLAKANGSAEAGGVPLGGSAGTGAASRTGEVTSVQTNTEAIQGALFMGQVRFQIIRNSRT